MHIMMQIFSKLYESKYLKKRKKEIEETKGFNFDYIYSKFIIHIN